MYPVSIVIIKITAESTHREAVSAVSFQVSKHMFPSLQKAYSIDTTTSAFSVRQRVKMIKWLGVLIGCAVLAAVPLSTFLLLESAGFTVRMEKVIRYEDLGASESILSLHI